jgi:hypothetical protein
MEPRHDTDLLDVEKLCDCGWQGRNRHHYLDCPQYPADLKARLQREGLLKETP